MSSRSLGRATQLATEHESPSTCQQPDSSLETQALYGNAFAKASMESVEEDSWFSTEDAFSQLGDQAPDLGSLWGLESQPRDNGGERNKGWIGSDETSHGVRGQAFNLGGEVVHKGGNGPESLVGGEVHVTGAGVSKDPKETAESGFWGGLRFLDAGATGIVGDDEYNDVGYRSDFVSGEVGYREIDAASRDDRGDRFGLSLGAPSFGFRQYGQDLDDDGHRELGYGLSVPIGPVGISIDRVSETPFGDTAIRMMDESMPTSIPLAGIANSAIAGFAGEESRPSTMIDDLYRSLLGETP